MGGNVMMIRWVVRFILCSTLAVISTACGQSASTQQTSATSTSLPITGSWWRPALQLSWQYQLNSDPLDPNLKVQVYDFDGFDHSATEVAALHAKGTKVICYINAGAWENFRTDFKKFPAAVLGKDLAGWPGEKWLDIRRLDLLTPLLTARMDMCQSKGFDAIEFDNVDGYTNPSGFPLTSQDQLAFNTFLANAAHQRGLAVGLKNDLDQVIALQTYFDFAVNEQCFEYQECDKLTPFIEAGKPVFNVEYNLETAKFCPKANAMNFNSLKKHLQLDAFRTACR